MFIRLFLFIHTKSTGLSINGGKPPSRVELAIIDLKNGNKNFGHSIIKIFSKISSVAFSMVKIPQYELSIRKAFYRLP